MGDQGDTTALVTPVRTSRAPRRREALRTAGWTVRFLVLERTVGTALLLLWMAFLVLTALSRPPLVTAERFDADLAAGRVTSWQVVDVQPQDEAPRWSQELELSSPARQTGADDSSSDGTAQRTVAYRTTSRFFPVRVVDAYTAPDGAMGMVDAARAAGVENGARDGHTLMPHDRSNWRGWAALPMAVIAFLAVVSGPAPTRGTRWFWFWFLFVPLGVGVVAYAVWERLLPLTRPGTPPPPRRRTGGIGLVLAVLVSMLVGTAVSGVADATHWLWVVRP